MLESSLDISFLVFEGLDRLLLNLDILLSLDASSDSRLDLVTVFFKQGQLFHQLRLLLDHLLVVLGQLLRILTAHLQLRFKLTDFLSQLVALEFTSGRLLYNLSLVLRGRLQ